MFTGSGGNDQVAMSLKSVSSWIKSYYDKIIALIVILLLIGSLFYLAVQIGMMRTMKSKFDKEIRDFKPKHSKADKLETKVFTEAMDSIEHPLVLTSDQWTNAMVFTPEKRVWCLGCRKPMPADAESCPFCHTVPVYGKETKIKTDQIDTDGDGIPDQWEVKYKLDPNDSTDANLDMDKDGFSNIEEFMAGTDPSDPKSHPPILIKLRLIRIDQDPFKLRFKGITKMPDGSSVFQLNLRGNFGTGFAQLGDTIAEVKRSVKVYKAVTNSTTSVSKVVTNEMVDGFKLVKYEPKTQEQEVRGIGKVMVDVSELTLQRGDKKIVLIKDKDVQWDEFTAQLLFTADNTTYTKKINDEIEVKNEKFKVISIDMAKQTIIIKSLNTGEETAIERFPDNKNIVPTKMSQKPAVNQRRATQ